MKKITGIFFLASLWLFFACEENTEPETQFTSLEVEVLDLNGNPRPQAQVQLYRNLVDLESRNYPALVALSDKNGIAHFQNLEAETYFVYASYQEGNTYFDNETQGDIFLEEPLKAGKTTRFVTLTNIKRPVKPSFVHIDEVWVMEYPTNTTLIYDDSTTQFTQDIYLGLLVEDQYYQETGPLVFIRSTSKDGIVQSIAASQKIPQPNPNISLEVLKKKPFIYLVFKGGGLEKGKLQASNAIPLNAVIHQGLGAYPDRLRILETDNSVIDLKLSWE